MKSIPLDQTNLQRLISITLRTGVTVAAGIGIVGGLLYLTTQGGQQVNFHAFGGDRSPYASLVGVAGTLDGGNHAERGLAIVQVGIAVLLLTPILRVALSIVGFAMEKDRMYVLITSVVLVTLMVSVLLH
jgi:uncharacterized membrane protein